MIEIFRYILLLYAGGVQAFWSAQTVSDFFIYNNIHSMGATLCSEKDSKHLLKNLTSLTRGGYLMLFGTQTTFDLEKIYAEKRTGIFFDLSCSKNQQLLYTVTEDWFNIAFVWLIWDEQDLLGDYNMDLPISTFSEVYALTNSSEIFRIRKDLSELPAIIDRVGFWDSETERLSLDPVEVRINFQKMTITAAIMFSQNVYDMDKLSEQLANESYAPGKDSSNRFVYGAALHLAYLYNYTLKLAVTNTWGEANPNGSWTGMLGLLQRKEADIALGGMLPLPKWMDVSYPAIPDLPYWMVVCFKQPRALGTYRAMILGLSPSTWAGVGVLIVTGAVVFTIIQKYEPNNHPTADSDSSLAMGLLQLIGIIANQGLPHDQQGTSSRILSLSLLLVGLLVSNYYSAATMTALLSESPPVIKSLEELLSSDIPLSSLDASFIKPTPTRPFYKVMMDQMDQKTSICTLENCVRSIMNGSAFFGEFFILFQAINDRVQSDAICDLTVFQAGPSFRAQSLTRKCPHFREMILRGQLRGFEHGLMQKERQKWLAEKLKCSRATEFVHVQLEAVSVALAVFLIGVITSTAVLICEIVTWKRIRESLSPKIIQNTVKTYH